VGREEPEPFELTDKQLKDVLVNFRARLRYCYALMASYVKDYPEMTTREVVDVFKRAGSMLVEADGQLDQVLGEEPMTVKFKRKLTQAELEEDDE
jgi:hypothetical protein